MEDKKPDGYVAWHPKDGIEPEICHDAKYCEWNLGFQHYDSSRESVEDSAERHIKDGWRIRPVKLVFLDED